MKARNLALSIIALCGLSACGVNYQGSYIGSTTLTASNPYGSYSQPTTGQATSTTQPLTTSNAATISLNQSSGTVTGTWQSGSQSGTLTAVANGSTLQNVILTSTGSAQGAVMSYPTMTNQIPACSLTYMGNLTYSNNQISGSLAPQTSGSVAGYGNCNGYTVTSISISVSKQ